MKDDDDVDCLFFFYKEKRGKHQELLHILLFIKQDFVYIIVYINMDSILPESLDELFPQLATMTENDKLLKLARHMPCDQCHDCQGWRPNFSLEFAKDTSCLCGHDADQHVDQKQDFIRRLKVAMRIDELLEV